MTSTQESIIISRDMAATENFSANFNRLLTNSDATYRKLASAAGMSLGNVTRLKNNNEPMLWGAVKIARYFGVTLEHIISPKPNFNFTEINASVMRNNRSPISYSTQSAEDKLAKGYTKTHITSYKPEQAVEFVSGLFNEVDGGI